MVYGCKYTHLPALLQHILHTRPQIPMKYNIIYVYLLFIMNVQLFQYRWTALLETCPLHTPSWQVQHCLSACTLNLTVLQIPSHREMFVCGHIPLQSAGASLSGGNVRFAFVPERMSMSGSVRRATSGEPFQFSPPRKSVTSAHVFFLDVFGQIPPISSHWNQFHYLNRHYSHNYLKDNKYMWYQ